MASRPSKRRRISPPASETVLSQGDNTKLDGASTTTRRQPPISAANGHQETDLEQEHGHSDGKNNEDDASHSEDESIASDKGTKDTRSSTAMRPPLTSRTNILKRTDTSKASVIRMQVDEMLRQVTPKYGKKEAPAEEMLRQLKTIIESIPERDALPIQDAEKRLLKSHKIAIPFPSPRPPPGAQYKLAFSKPSSINVVGSYVLKTASRVEGRLSIDLVVNMPSSLFSPKDYLDYRYFHKRAYYIACIAAGIRNSSELKMTLSFSCLHGNSLLPVILVQPEETDVDSRFATSNCDIYIIPAVSEDCFSLPKTYPNRNCIRSHGTTSEAEAPDAEPTPFYNATIRTDGSVTSYLKLLHSAGAKCSGFREACILGRIWLRQRGFGGSLQKGGFGHFEWAALVALLLQGGGPQGKPVLLSSYDGYQLFRATVQFLALKSLSKQPLLIEGENSEPDMPSQAAFGGMEKGNSLPMLFDQIRGLNILYKMTPWSYTVLRKEAQASVKMLTTLPDPFESLFIFKVDEVLIQNDLVIRLGMTQGVGIPQDSLEIRVRMMQFYNNLTRGLGDRAKSINMISPMDQPWPTNTSRPRQREILLEVGIVLDLDTASRTVDRGPSAEDGEAAASFREFWGEKAELRRFKDGQILECVAWDDSDPISITKQIAQYLIRKQVPGEDNCSIYFLGNDFGSAPAELHNLSTSSGASEEQLSAFRILENQIRALEGLPLQIRHIQAARPGLRNSSSTPMSPSKYQGAIPTDVMIQFEGSGRWPDDLSAIAMTKIAFLLKLDELLSEKAGNLTTKLGLENEHNEILNRSFLDVINPTGAAFRLRIHHEREQMLIQRRLADKSLSPGERGAAAIALADYKMNFIQKPLHTQAMQSLVTRFRAITPTVHAVKTWFNSHLLGNHFPEELIEIIVARVFLQPHPWQVPSSAMTGFLRTLHFLASWDWLNDPLIVDFSGSMKKDELTAGQTRFEAWRKIDPTLNRIVMFVATNYDLEGTTWTEYHPAKVVASRMTSLAKAACKAIVEKGLDLDLGSLFKSPAKDFDFVIHVNPRFTKSNHSNKAQSKYKNLVANGLDDSLVGYNPVKLYVDELQHLYGDNIVLFCDWSSQSMIAGLWSPHTSNRKWKMNLPYSTIPVGGNAGEEETDAAINKEAILNEMARLGSDMILSVESNR